MSTMLLPIVFFILTIVFFLEFRRRLKRKNFNGWLLSCLVICILAFIAYGLPILHLEVLLAKFCPIRTAKIIIAGAGVTLMLGLLKIVKDKVEKFVSLEETWEKKNKISVGLFKIGTVVELKHPDGRLEILCYLEHGPFQDNFINVNPKSGSFGILTVWDEDSEYAEWAYTHAKKIGHISIEKLKGLMKPPKEKLEDFLIKELGVTLS